MANWPIFGFALVTGLTVSGLAASLASILMQAPAGFREPFVSRDRFFPSLLITAIAGPIMLFNEAVASLKHRRVGLVFFVFCAATVAGWALALGILAMELVWRASTLVT